MSKELLILYEDSANFLKQIFYNNSTSTRLVFNQRILRSTGMSRHSLPRNLENRKRWIPSVVRINSLRGCDIRGKTEKKHRRCLIIVEKRNEEHILVEDT